MATVSYETCPTSAPFFGFMGVTAALCFASKCYAKNAGSIALSVPLRVFVRAMALRCCATPSLAFFPWLSSPLTWPGKKFVSMRCCCVKFCRVFASLSHHDVSLLPILDADIGAAYGTAKSGVGIASMGVMNPGLVMRNIIPVVMAGVLGIYGLIVALILSQQSYQCASATVAGR